MSDKIILRKGVQADIPVLDIGEPAFTTDTHRLYVGSSAGNVYAPAVLTSFPVPQLASAPAYVKGGMYFDTTLNKLRIGGATAWETVTSV
jgi:hypothetical protein